MKLLILGGGSGQLSAIKRAKKEGYTVIVSDYYPDAPGKKYADYGELSSTFDIEANIGVAKKYNIDGVMTLGTDQPVYTASKVAETMGLPYLIDSNTARAVTNKKYMKDIFRKNQIPTARFKYLNKDFKEKELKNFKFPVVLKPFDSQGQRGVLKLNSIKEIREHFDEVLSFSREKEILLEEYYPSNEITLSGWVDNENVHILSVTDRITYENSPHIGICTAHYFPSRYLYDYYQEIKGLTYKIVRDFNIKNGPIYFQYLIGEEGIKVNEIACRIGGAYEADFMSKLSGVDILSMVIDSSLGKAIDNTALKSYNLLDNNKWLSVQLLFARAGRIYKLTELGEILSLPGVLKVDFNFAKGEEIGKIKNATERAGYFIIIAENREDLKIKLNRVYNNLKIYNAKMENLIIKSIGLIL